MEALGPLAFVTGVGGAGGSGLALIGAYSRKVHGSAGPFSLAIDTTKTINQQITIEPRGRGAGHVIVFQFNQSIAQPGMASAVDAMSVNTGTITNVTTQGNEVHVSMMDIPDNRRVTVA